MATNNDTGLEFVVIAIAAPGVALVGGIWIGATVAALAFGTHQGLGVAFADTIRVLPQLAHHLYDPATAWPNPARRRLPGPVGYWTATIPVLAVELVTIVVAATAFSRRHRPGVESRRRMGLDPEARFATAADLAPLWVDGPTPGRVILGRVEGHLVATEDRTAPLPRLPWRLRREAGRRCGDRGAVIAIGPSRCGKTSALAIPAVLEWVGPVIALSVKSDLMGATIRRRGELGDVKVFDPCDMTWEPTCQWSPLRSSHTYSGAKNAAAGLADAVAPDASGQERFWNEQAQALVAALMFVAANTDQTMDAVVRWIVAIDRPARRRICQPDRLADDLIHRPDVVVARDAMRARRQLDGIWTYPDEQLSSIYLTAKAMISRWDDDTVMASAAGDDPPVDLAWLLDRGPDGQRANTLYLCAPLKRAAQMAPVLGGLIADLLEQAYRAYGKNDTPIGPLLLVIDEAGNWPIRDLPAIAATCAGVGIQLMVVYQSKAQIDAAYGRQADTLMSSCITKVFFAGISDPASLDYGVRLLGDEHINQTQVSFNLAGGIRGNRSVSESPTRIDLLPAALLRQLPKGEALLVHNTLRPAHLRGRQWFDDDELHLLARGEPKPRKPECVRRRIR